MPPPPKRSDPDDYCADPPEVAQPHQTELCREQLPDADETLKWNQPAFVQDGTPLVMLQSFTQHRSLWFRPVSSPAARRRRGGRR